MTDSKEWVTVKIPKETRDDAQDDERTYDAIMRAGLGEQPSNSEADVDELVDRLKDELSMANTPGVAVDVERLYSQIDELEEAVKEATNAAQNAEQAVEDLR